MKLHSDALTFRNREKKRGKRRSPKATKTSKLRDDYLKNLQHSNLSRGSDPDQIRLTLQKKARLTDLRRARADRLTHHSSSHSVARRDSNRSVDQGRLPQIRKGNIESLKTEIADRRLNVTHEDVQQYKRVSRKDRDEMLSDYFRKK